MIGTDQAAFSEMQVIKNLLGTQNLGFKIKPNGDKNELWGSVCFSDDNYSSNSDRRGSISELLYMYWASSLEI